MRKINSTRVHRPHRRSDIILKDLFRESSEAACETLRNGKMKWKKLDNDYSNNPEIEMEKRRKSVTRTNTKGGRFDGWMDRPEKKKKRLLEPHALLVSFAQQSAEEEGRTQHLRESNRRLTRPAER